MGSHARLSWYRKELLFRRLLNLVASPVDQIDLDGLRSAAGNGARQVILFGFIQQLVFRPAGNEREISLYHLVSPRFFLLVFRARKEHTLAGCHVQYRVWDEYALTLRLSIRRTDGGGGGRRIFTLLTVMMDGGSRLRPHYNNCPRWDNVSSCLFRTGMIRGWGREEVEFRTRELPERKHRSCTKG